MKNLFKGKINAYTVLFSIMAVLFTAYCVDQYFIQMSTQISAGTLLSTMFAAGGIIPWIKNDKFVALPEDDVKELEVEDLAKYHKALSEEKEEKLKELIESKAPNDDLVKLQEDLVKHQKEVTEIKETLGDVKLKETLEELEEKIQKQIDEAGLEITKLKEGGGTGKRRTMFDIIKEALDADNIKDFYERGLKGASKAVKLDVKDVTAGGFTNDVIQPDRHGPDVSYIKPKKFDIRQVMSGGTSDKDVIDHIKETGYTDNAGFLAENAEAGESTLNLEQVKTDSKRLGVFIDVSKKALRNVAFLTNHLTNRFNEQLVEKLTDSVLNGTGAGNAFDGFFNNATTFTAGSLAAKVDEANVADVLAAAMTRLAEITNLQATAIFINPLDEYLLTVTKDTTGNYAESNVVVSRVGGRLHINAVPVYTTFHVTADKYLVADLSSTSTEYFEVEGIEMSMSEHHDKNFIKNLVTFLFEVEAILPIYKTFAFLKGTISTDKALLETV